MKTSLLAMSLVLGSLAAAGVQAQSRHALDRASAAITLFDSARVESVEPQIERTRIPGQCRIITVTEEVRGAEGSGTGGAIVGGVLGGLLGSQVGGGSGKTAATAVGAIAGAIAGGNMERQGPPQVTSRREVCEPDAWRETVTGYLVTYRYRGQEARVWMERDPGDTIELRVTAEPVR